MSVTAGICLRLRRVALVSSNYIPASSDLHNRDPERLWAPVEIELRSETILRRYVGHRHRATKATGCASWAADAQVGFGMCPDLSAAKQDLCWENRHQNHCPGSISPRSSNCRECHSNGAELCHLKVGMSYVLPGLRLSALAVRKEQTAAVMLWCHGQA